MRLVTIGWSFEKLNVTLSLLLLSGIFCDFAFAEADETQNKSRVTVDAKLRARYENANWFEAPDIDSNNDFGHSKLQTGIAYTADDFKFYLQGQYTQLYDLPSNAAGPGSVYYATNDDQHSVGEVSVRQAWLSLESATDELTIGRQLFSGGAESMPRNSVLADVRAKRIAQRLIGPFDFTAGRSFDGAQSSISTDIGALSPFFFMPTEGGFEIDQNQTIYEVKLAGLSWTLPFRNDEAARSDAQIFSYFYRDDRSVTKTDNRDAALRIGDLSEVQIATVGGHLTSLLNTGAHPIDFMFWGAGQFGDWGEQDHAAWAFSAEIGGRFADTRFKPNWRIGYTRGSGDSNSSDNDHGTFFQLLPTARAYASTPFYNMQNTSDLFVQFAFNALESLSIKYEFHQLWLSEDEDLLYSGAGVNEKRNRFGYSGSPSKGGHNVGTLADIEVSWKVDQHLLITTYYGHLFGDNAVQALGEDSGDIDYFLLEFTATK